VHKYQKRISGPLLDRIDLYVDISPVKFEKLSGEKTGETSERIKGRVQAARDRQQSRFEKEKITTNAEMGVGEIEKHCPIDETAKELLAQAMKQFQLSGRAYHRILKVARTIADLNDAEKMEVPHIAEALQYRPKFSEV
jgi:magnesium chelatase family protein